VQPPCWPKNLGGRLGRKKYSKFWSCSRPRGVVREVGRRKEKTKTKKKVGCQCPTLKKGEGGGGGEVEVDPQRRLSFVQSRNSDNTVCPTALPKRG